MNEQIKTSLLSYVIPLPTKKYRLQMLNALLGIGRLTTLSPDWIRIRQPGTLLKMLMALVCFSFFILS